MYYFSQIFRNHRVWKKLIRNVEASHFPRHFHFHPLSVFITIENKKSQLIVGLQCVLKERLEHPWA